MERLREKKLRRMYKKNVNETLTLSQAIGTYGTVVLWVLFAKCQFSAKAPVHCCAKKYSHESLDKKKVKQK